MILPIRYYFLPDTIKPAGKKLGVTGIRNGKTGRKNNKNTLSQVYRA
jgi:hypothetical protein